MALTKGEVLDGKYRVGRLIGEGGMGAVFEGEHILIRRRVAIKALLSGVASADVVQRFQREAQAAGTIGNDHILEVMDLGRHPNGTHYMVMEYLDGETLTDRMRARQRLTCEELALLLRQVLTGLGAAHDAGIIHRDLKPDNIFILREKAGRPDFVKLIDFGISRFTAGGGESLRMTKDGAMLGTPCYMSPEQARGTSDTDVRSDIYALGVIMYEAVSGVLPFDSTSFHDLLFKIVLATPTPLEELVPGLDSRFSRMVMKAMARDPHDRFPSVRDFARDLDEWTRGRTFVQGSSVHTAGFLAGPPPSPASATAPYAPTAAPPSHESQPGAVAKPTPPAHDSLGHDRTWAATRAEAATGTKKPAPRLIVGLGLTLATVIIVAAVFGITRGKKPITPAAAPGLVATTASAETAAAAVPLGTTAPDRGPAEKVAEQDAEPETPRASSSAPVAVKGKVPHRPPTSAPSSKPNGTSSVPDFGY
jgi:serine/threonine-protein kinase